VALESAPAVISPPHQRLDPLISLILDSRNGLEACVLLPATPLETLVPLAGLLLEYPVTYVPTSLGHSAFLNDVELNVVHSELVSSDGLKTYVDADNTGVFLCVHTL
jgi:hypothetical protein